VNIGSSVEQQPYHRLTKAGAGDTEWRKAATTCAQDIVAFVKPLANSINISSTAHGLPFFFVFVRRAIVATLW